MNRAKVLLLPLLVLPAFGGCKSASASRPVESAAVKQNPVLREPEQVAAALQAANDAFMASDWGEAVLQANRVMEGNASPEQYYEAVKILGLASCNRRDALPVGHAWKRLSPDDRGSLQRECAQNGIIVSDDGRVTSEPAQGGASPGAPGQAGE
jgi:hypothetical protein